MLLPYKRYADFKGRSARSEYWLFVLFYVIVTMVGVGLMMSGGFNFIMMENGETADMTFGPMFFVGAGLLGLFWLVTLIPGIAVTVRRFHDRDMSGWWVLGFAVLGSLPYIGVLFSIAQIVILALPGTRGVNRFGPDPLDPLNTDVFG